MDIRILEELGLTKAEARVYLVLIDLGQSLAGKIAAVANLHRRTAYDVLERLIEKGLVQYIRKNNRKWYEAVNPEILLKLLEEKQADIKAALPELLAKYSFVKERKETTFLRGKPALKGIFNDQLQTAKEILVLGGSENADAVVKYYFPKYDNERKRKGIRVRGLYNNNAKIPLSDIKFIPKEFQSDVAINIWQDKTAIILWKEDPMAVLIKDPRFADGFRKYFEYMWDCSGRGSAKRKA